MTALLPSSGDTEQLVTALRSAHEQLDTLFARAHRLREDMESGRWTGIEEYINSGERQLRIAQDRLNAVADTAGVQGQILRDAREAATTAGDRDTITD